MYRESGKLFAQHKRMNSEPLGFSIIIPTYNRGYILDEAISSVLNQQAQVDIEIIVVDDGSTDNTQKVIDSVGDERIKYFSQSNQGPSSARNLGLKNATKDWIVYLDSDNKLYPNYFKVISDYILSNPDMTYSMVRAHKTYVLYENGKVIQTKEDMGSHLEEVSVQDLFHYKAIFDVNGFFHRRDIVGDIKWDEKLARIEDWDFFMSIAERHPNGFIYISQPVLDYKMRFGTDGILSNSSYIQWAEAFEYIYQKHKNDKLLQGQQWYPAKVEYYRQKQIDFEAGRVPPPHLRIFLRD